MLNNMRSKQEIIDYLQKQGFTSEALSKIMGFLIGCRIKTKDETFYCKLGDSDFEVFYDWFNRGYMDSKIIRELNCMLQMRNSLLKVRVIAIE